MKAAFRGEERNSCVNGTDHCTAVLSKRNGNKNNGFEKNKKHKKNKKVVDKFPNQCYYIQVA